MLVCLYTDIFFAGRGDLIYGDFFVSSSSLRRQNSALGKKKILQASQVKYVRAGEKTKITPGENKNK